MYQLLIKIWWKQQVRSFTWKDLFIYGYFFFVLACMAFGFYAGAGESMKSLLSTDFSPYAVGIIAAFLPFDLLVKAGFKKEAPIMDDYLRSRPCSQRAWDAFLTTVNVANFWTWAFPISLAVLFLIFMPTPLALLGTVAALSMSMVNAMTFTCFRRADSWWLKWPMLAVMLLFFCGTVAYATLTAMLDIRPTTQLSVYLLFNIVSIALLYLYLTQMHSYDEHAIKTKRVRSMGGGTSFSLEVAGLLRTKRLKQMVIFITLFMVADTYLVLSTGSEDYSESFFTVILFAVCIPSVALAQWTFGVEANFFHGLWTKPVSIYQLLVNKFRFFALLNVIAAVLLLPAVVIGWLNPLMLGAILIYTIGFVNLVCMPTCLFSTRLDLFSSAFFNYQGANMKINVYSIVVLLPIGWAWFLQDFFSEQTIMIAFSILGIAGLLVHPLALRSLANIFIRRRHSRFEAYIQ